MKPKLTRLIFSLAAISVLLAPGLARAQSAVDSAFNPNQLISDSDFSNVRSFSGPDAIQKFLEAKNSVLAKTSTDFLVLLKEPGSSSLKSTLEDPRPNSDKLRTAAEIIWDASQSSGLNPQVILVTLNKEQSLITGSFSADRLQRALDFSMGFGCPDSGGCGDIYRGFYHQLFGGVDHEGSRYLGAAKSLMRSFTTPGGRGPFYNGGAAQVGDTIILSNTLGGYSGVQPQQNVTLKNSATAALYRYTPHVFNGNYNFWRFYRDWFGESSNEGELVKVKGDKNLYVIENGTRYAVTPLVAELRGINAASARTISSKTLQKYPEGKAYGPADNTVVSVDGKFYVFMANVMRPASGFTLASRQLNSTGAIKISSSQAAAYEKGAVLAPPDGSVLRGEKNPPVYLVEGGVLKLFTFATFTERGAAKIMQVIPDSEIDAYPKDGMVAPTGSSLVKSLTNPTVYLLEKGARYGLTAQLFANREFSFKDINVMSDAEIQKIGYGGFALPKENTAIKSSTNPTVYYVLSGEVRPMTYEAFVARKVNPASIIVFSQADLDTYAKGSILTK